MEFEDRKAVLDFVKNYYAEYGKAPSIAQICRQIPKMYREKLYRLFPGRLVEICRASGIPVPRERIESTQKALRSREGRSRRVSEASPSGLVLTSEQTRLVYGICHLEGGKDASVVIDELLRHDRERRHIGLGLDDIKIVHDFLGEMEDRGWSPKSLMDLLNGFTVRSFLMFLRPRYADKLKEFLLLDRPNGMTGEQFMDELLEGAKLRRLLQSYGRDEMSDEQFLEALKE